MSFGALPTELDQRMLDLLEHEDLHEISQVNKYLRGLAEPLIYRHIDFKTGNDTYARLLLLTLIERPELAAHIQSVSLAGTHTEDYYVTNYRRSAFTRVQGAISRIHDIIRDAVGSQRDAPKICVSWLGAVLSDDCMEGSLALIISLAVNVESIQLETPETRYGYRLGRYLSVLNHDKDPIAARSLMKLRQFSVQARTSIQFPLVPQLESLKIRDATCCLPRMMEHLPAPINLHTIELIGCRGPSWVARDICGLSSAASLVRFVLRGVPFDSQQCSQETIDALQKHSPKLQYLEISDVYIPDETDDNGPVGEDEVSPLQRWHLFTSLKTLRVDLDLLVNEDHRLHLLDPQDILPQDLEELHITAMCHLELEELVQDYCHAMFRMPMVAEADMLNLVSKFSFTYLTLTVNNAPKDVTRRFITTKTLLAKLAQLLEFKTRLKVEVYRTARRHDDESCGKLLVSSAGCPTD